MADLPSRTGFGMRPLVRSDMRFWLAWLTIGCGSPVMESGTSTGSLAFVDAEGNERRIELDGGALSFECGRCDAVWVVLTDQPRNFDCAWAHANYGSDGQRVPDRGGEHHDVFWDARFPDAIQVVRTRTGLTALLDDQAETYSLPATMVGDEPEVRGELWVEDQDPVRFEAEYCGRID